MLEHANGDRHWQDPKTSAIIGAAIEVHKRLGCGFLEIVFVEAVAVEFKIRSIPFRREVSYPVYYRDQLLGSSFRVDFLCFDDVVVEVKALSALTTSEFAQVLNYLKASGNTRGLLLNFGTKSLEFKRVVLNYDQRR
jgi:GxxExxY protein